MYNELGPGKNRHRVPKHPPNITKPIPKQPNHLYPPLKNPDNSYFYDPNLEKITREWTGSRYEDLLSVSFQERTDVDAETKARQEYYIGRLRCRILMQEYKNSKGHIHPIPTCRDDNGDILLGYKGNLGEKLTNDYLTCEADPGSVPLDFLGVMDRPKITD